MGGVFSIDALKLDAAAEIERIAATLHEQVQGVLRRRGVVLGLSGGIDSSVVAGLAARALGKERVLALLMPERHSGSESLTLGKLVADSLGIEALVENIGPVLEAAGCYSRQDEAARSVVPEYGAGWKCKLVLPSLLESERLNVTRLTVQSPTGDVRTVRLTSAAYLQLVAATNYKQRVRKLTEHARSFCAWPAPFAIAGPTSSASIATRAQASRMRASRSSTCRPASNRSPTRTARSSSCSTARSSTMSNCARSSSRSGTASARAAIPKSSSTPTKLGAMKPSSA